jgi:predicted small metal-binding protein
MTSEQAKESSELMDKTIEQMRKSHALMIEMAGKAKKNVGVA